jgi:hypothetical protein
MKIIMTFFTNNGKKVLIKPYYDTHFGQINHQWAYDKKEKTWAPFEPRLTRIELSVENLTKYFDQFQPSSS